jgi:F420-dependent oxidoreductase-like protein
VKFGVHTGLQNTSISELQSLWRQIEELGFDWISIWDHFYAADGTGNPHCLEAVASHAALAATTSRVRCGSLVYSVGYRHPAVLANAAATLDQLSDGRITLGLGGGWLADEYNAYGIEFPPVGVRLRQVEEAIQCVRGLLTQDVTSFDGKFFTLDNARCEPKPVQERLPLWIGGGGEKVTLRTAARHADGWNVPFISPEDFGHKVGVLDRHCEDASRDPAEITRSVNVGIAFSDEDLKAQFGNIAEYVRPGVLTGSVNEMVDRVGAYRDAGAEWLILAMRAPFDTDGLDRFAAEVLPALSQ